MHTNILLMLNTFNSIVLLCAIVFLLRKKNIIHLLLSFALLSILILEVGKITNAFDLVWSYRVIGFGFCFFSITWLLASVAFLPGRSHSLIRVALSPLLGILSLIFFVIWWVRPFIFIDSLTPEVEFNAFTWYFFVLFIFNVSLSLSNFERSYRLSRDTSIRNLLIASIFLLLPYLLLATHAVIFTEISKRFLQYSSWGVLVGALVFLLSSRRGFIIDIAKESTAIQSSLTLVLVGGYLFIVGAFIKLFQLFGLNVHTFYSFLTTAFLLCVFVFLLFSSQVRDRIRNTLFRHLSRQKYDWQKIWQEFTYQISLATELGTIEQKIKDAVSKILNISGAEVIVFRESPFEEGFSDWFLRHADVIRVPDVFNDEFRSLYPRAHTFFQERHIVVATPLYGEKSIIGVIGFLHDNQALHDHELLKVLSLQASSVIVNGLAYQKLQEAEKKESIYRMSSFVIHDVKNYINNLSMLIANKSKFSNPAFQKDALFTLDSTISRMQRLVDEFRALRGDMSLNKKPLRVAEMIESVLRDIGEQRLRQVAVEKQIDASLSVVADEHSLYKVVLNVILNACEAMRGQGALTIATRVDAKRLCIDIADTGMGMNSDFIEHRLFKPFQTTKEKGLGIGLYQCKSLIQAHGGDITATSQEGKGSTFTVVLPYKNI